MHIADGSGLSRLNGVTPRQFAYFLKSIHNGEHGESFLRTLPVAGESGTLKYIAGGTPAAGRIHAKSGTLERTKCYVGYADARSGKRYAFAIMVNNFTGDYYPIRKGIERIMTALVSALARCRRPRLRPQRLDRILCAPELGRQLGDRRADPVLDLCAPIERPTPARPSWWVSNSTGSPRTNTNEGLPLSPLISGSIEALRQ